MNNNSIPHPLATGPRLNSEVYELVLRLMGNTINYNELNSLLKQVIKLDRGLGLQLEGLVNGHLSDALECGFAVGWQASRQPELLIFEDGDE